MTKQDWPTVERLALEFDGYDALGGFDACADFANAAADAFGASGEVPGEDREVRACLFFEARRWRHFGTEPDPTAWKYIGALLRQLNYFGGGDRVEAGREAEYRRSSFYEQLVEHVFVSELLQEAWFRFGEVMEVLRSEVDASGYDVVLECRGIVRHVQLKTSRSDAKTATQKVNLELSRKPSGCVVWLQRKEDREACRMKLTYLFFGGNPGEALPDLEQYRVARHTKANSKGVKAERPGLRVVPKRQFERVASTTELLDKLFGLR